MATQHRYGSFRSHGKRAWSRDGAKERERVRNVGHECAEITVGPRDMELLESLLELHGIESALLERCAQHRFDRIAICLRTPHLVEVAHAAIVSRPLVTRTRARTEGLTATSRDGPPTTGEAAARR